MSRESFCFAAQKNSCTFSSFLSFVIVCCCNFFESCIHRYTLALNKSCTKCPDRYFIYSNVGGALHVFLQNFLSHIFISRVFFVVSVVEPCMFPFSSLIHEIAIINNDDTGIIAIFVSTGLFSPIFQSIRIVKVTLLHHDLLSWSITLIVTITLVRIICHRKHFR